MGRGTGKGTFATGWPDGLAGVSSKGVFRATPDWVDPTRPPGHTAQTETLGLSATARAVGSLKYFVMSPNLVWFAMALGFHLLAPYPIAQAREQGLALSWILPRFGLNYAVALVYYGFFYVGLYWFGMSERKYREKVWPTMGNMAHNMFYWSLAIVQWTWWEAVMVRLWATGLVPFVSDQQLLASPWLLAVNLCWVLAIPLWRDLHFYIAHRFIHIRAVYKYVHSLHHRNADPEPFSGMTMHPVEHLYYFSNAFTPSLYLSCLSPLIFQWNFIHLTIAPGAGHSGWEDHFQADQYHYVHHAKFECNYGSPSSAFIDQFFGTFREQLGTSTEYKGEYADKKEPAKKKEWSPQGYLGWPASWDHGVYSAYWMALFVLVGWAALLNQGPARLDSWAGVPIGQLVAAVVAYSPPVVALLVCKLSGDRMSWRWPFQKERMVGPFGLFLVLGWMACIMPVYHATAWIC